MNKRYAWLSCCLLAGITVSAQRLDRQLVGNIPTVTVPCTPVKNQFLSSTCWSFSSTSLLESELLKAGKGKKDLSEMFIARYSMVRKIERHLALRGGNFFTPGGQFHDAVWVMKQYGMVPESAFSGKGRGETNHDHAEMDTVLSHFVQEAVAAGVTRLDAGRRAFVDSVLDYYYGRVPSTFIYMNKQYTPKTYLEKALGINPDDFVEITSYTHHPFYSRFVLEDKYNWTGDLYWNVPLADFMRILNTALDSGYSVGWDGDAEDPGFDYNEGLAYLPDSTRKSGQAERQEDFENTTTLLNHMMHIVGKTTGPAPVWYFVKNSWGYDSNPLGGFLYMREDYFRLRTVAIIVNKKAIPADLRKKMSL